MAAVINNNSVGVRSLISNVSEKFNRSIGLNYLFDLNQCFTLIIVVLRFCYFIRHHT